MRIIKLYQRIPIRIRISVGLVGLMIGSLLIASAGGFFPNEQEEILRGRAKLCETLAISGTAMISGGRIDELQAVLVSVVERDKSIRSIGLVNDEGLAIVSAGEHNNVWDANANSDMTQMRVPVFRHGKQWGELQVAFHATGGILGLNYWAPAWLLVVLVPACLLQFSFFLRKTLESLDASGAIPTHVENALDTFTVGLVLLNSRDRIIFANQRLTTLLGLDSKSLVGKRTTELAWIHPEGENSTLPWGLAKDSASPVNDQILQFDVDGRRLTFSVNCTPITGQGYLATFDDITLIEENKVALAEARDAAQNANEAKSQFLANMSHEIRTPLNAVLGFTDVLRRGLVTDSNEAVDHLNMIHRSGSHLLELINDILDLSKIEAGRLQAESINTHVDEIVIDVAAVLSVRACENDLKLETEFKTPIPRIIQNDPTRLKQVITNLVGNAIKFTEQGSVRVVTELITTAGSTSSLLRIDVVDSGIGMTAEQQSKIFQSFVQADSTTTRRFGGTGLGLSISRRLTEAMGGSLTVMSEANVGSTFRIELPVTQDNIDDLVTPDEISQSTARRANAAESGGIISLPAKPILVVDDGEANRRLIELILKRAGAVVSCAENGLEAIKTISENDYELILMDMQMPVLDGYEATRRLRQVGLKTPIIALTGNAMRGDREKCIAAGCDDFLTKPVNLDQLLALVANYVGTAEGPTTQSSPPRLMNSSNVVPTNSIGSLSAPDQGDANEPIYSTLPMEDIDFHTITSDFLDRLDGRLDQIERAIQHESFDVVCAEAHWLKGSGGTVGLPVFTQPAASLEQAAKRQSKQEAHELLTEIRDLRERIVIPALGQTPKSNSPASPLASTVSNSAGDGIAEESAREDFSNDLRPIHSTLPADDSEFCEIIADFVIRLERRLVEMRQRLEAKDYVQLADMAHWLKGAGGTVGYAEFTEPAAKLVASARASNANDSLACLTEIESIHRRLVVPCVNR